MSFEQTKEDYERELDDLVRRLKDLGAYKHADQDVGYEAADTIQFLRAKIRAWEESDEV
jgi:hypothetical protein